MRDALVLVPAFEAEATIGELIIRIKRMNTEVDVLVVDDGSDDDTTVIARKSGARVQQHQRNYGKGAALRTGYAYAVAGEYKTVITMDSDLQHDPCELSRFLAAGAGGSEIVIGVRERSGDMPLPRRLSNFLVSFLCSLLAGRKLADAQCGYRLLPIAVLKQVSLVINRYESEMELLIRTGRAGWPIRELKVATIYNSGRSYIRPVTDTIRFLAMAVKSIFW
jgi:glycosyltransferase involved in cell wall biosynthesis